MKNNSGFQTIALTRIHESNTNPRRIFDESQLAELADFVSLTVLWPKAPRSAWQTGEPHSDGT
jgi:hypothetical protein